MFQDASVSFAAGPTIWCTVKCGGACLAGCAIDGPGPADVVAAAYGFADFGGK